MSGWLSALLVILALYALFVAVLVVLGRRADAGAVVRLIPDCVVLARRLVGDERVARRHKVALVALAGYLVFPIDLVPDFIPIAGQLDDAILVVLVMRAVLRGAGPHVVSEHWPGPPRGLELLLRAC